MLIKYSWRFCLLLLLAHTLAAVAIQATVLPLAARLALLVLIFLSLIYYLMRDVFLLLPDSWCQVLFEVEKGEIELVTRDGVKVSAQLAYGIIVTAYFVVLRCKLPGHVLPRSRVIFPDALNPGVFRDFCVRLKFAG